MNEAILISYLKGQCDVVETHMVEQWCNESSDNMKVLSDLRFIMQLADVAETIDNIDIDASFNKFKHKIATSSPVNKCAIKRYSKFSKLYRHTASIAAFFIGVIFSTGLIFLLFSNSLESSFTLATELGQKAQTILPDGSKVWINSSSKLTYTNSFWSSDRTVDLVGEAYFEVAPRSSEKFIVRSKDIQTVVLGTKFNVRTKPTETKIVTTLFEGSVKVTSNSRFDGNGCTLVPGETVEIDTETGNVLLTKYDNPTNVLLWMGGNFKFDQKSLGEITDILENLFDIDFIFENDIIREEIFTGSFSTDSSPEQILNILQYTNYFNYKVNGNVIYIYK